MLVYPYLNLSIMKKLADLFEHEIKDLYSAEKQLTEALPKMVEAASDKRLKQAFSDHLEETKNQLKRVKEICDELEVNPGSTKCDAMEGLIKEAQHMIKEDADAAVKDAGLIATAQRVEHYEISGYGTAVRFAKELGHDEIAGKLQKTLDEEYNADHKLNDLAEGRLNKKALSR
jgi:ferritin-like metal-binding protein YciE